MTSWGFAAVFALDLIVCSLVCYGIRDDPPEDIAFTFLVLFVVLMGVLTAVLTSAFNPS